MYQKITSLFHELAYIVNISAPKQYKLRYFLDRLQGFIPFIFGKDQRFRTTNFLRGDYVIRNSTGVFKIDAGSDMNFIVKPFYEADIYQYMKVPDEKIFLDIGANIGKYTVFVGNNQHPKQIIAFEPNPFLYRNYLFENIQLNKLQSLVSLVNLGLGDKESVMTLNVPIGFFGSGSMKSTFKKQDGIEVQIMPLDLYFKNMNINISDVGLIKIDVEGFEREVLLGARHLLGQIKNCRIIIESFKKEEIVDILEDAGFIEIATLYGDNFIYEKGSK